MRSTCTILILVSLLLPACQKKSAARVDSEAPKDLIVGRWSSRYTNPPPGDKSAVPGLDLEFEFRVDGTFRTGKRKIWIEGKYRFLSPNAFEMDIKGHDAGPYQITEASTNRIIYERKLISGGVQRTELTRLP